MYFGVLKRALNMTAGNKSSLRVSQHACVCVCVCGSVYVCVCIGVYVGVLKQQEEMFYIGPKVHKSKGGTLFVIYV